MECELCLAYWWYSRRDVCSSAHACTALTCIYDLPGLSQQTGIATQSLAPGFEKMLILIQECNQLHTIRTQKHTYVCTYINTYIHIYIYIHTYIHPVLSCHVFPLLQLVTQLRKREQGCCAQSCSTPHLWTASHLNCKTIFHFTDILLHLFVD